MNIFEELEIQYNEIDNQYSSEEFKAVQRGWVQKEKKYKRKREINDQAYFIFMFSRLEDRIRVESAKLIKKKKSTIKSWRQKASWEILPSKPDADLYFKKRLALLTQKDGRDFNRVSEYYKERNSIAHGGSFIKQISMPIVIGDLKRLYKILKT
ncbi:MAG: hypothetical protein L3V56_08700 [Candidatus Magnetoovum sp. WYHC-5]|nr:hypothetical protein [Candidatus Magnetoovum sp. WYHC-5]